MRDGAGVLEGERRHLKKGMMRSGRANGSPRSEGKTEGLYRQIHAKLSEGCVPYQHRRASHEGASRTCDNQSHCSTSCQLWATCSWETGRKDWSLRSRKPSPFAFCFQPSSCVSFPVFHATSGPFVSIGPRHLWMTLADRGLDPFVTRRKPARPEKVISLAAVPVNWLEVLCA